MATVVFLCLRLIAVPSSATRLDEDVRHSPRVDRLPLCAFAPAPAGVDPGHILEDLRPRLTGNELNSGSFAATRSVKWRFGGAPGALEAAMASSGAETAIAWARPLVEALRLPSANLFLLNGLAVRNPSRVSVRRESASSRKDPVLQLDEWRQTPKKKKARGKSTECFTLFRLMNRLSLS